MMFFSFQTCLIYEDSEVDDCEIPVSPIVNESDDAVNNSTIFSGLSKDQCAEIEDLVNEFSDAFSNIPGCTSLVEHGITLASTKRLKPQVYPIPIHLQSHFEKEVVQLLDQGIIRLSSSPHCSPVVMVKKSDGIYRMAID